MRFCVLHHTDCPGLADHYDLLLQAADGLSDDDAVLKTWATESDVFPTGEGDGTPMLKRADHRRLYLQFEGPLTGARGRVTRVDSGKLEWLPGPDGTHSPESGIRLEGARLRGIFSLQRRAENQVGFRKFIEN